MTTDSKKLVVDVWSDVMCPWCYLGVAQLVKAVADFAHGEDVEVRYHAYQLMPQLLADKPTDMEQILAQRGIPKAQLQMGQQQITARGKELGLSYAFAKVVAINTRAAHRLGHFAAQHGKQHEMGQRIFRAHFTEGLNVGDYAVLADLAAEIGLDRHVALDALTSNAFDDAVDADLKAAREIGIQGVPFFVVDGKYALSGAQPARAFAEALDTAWKAKG